MILSREEERNEGEETSSQPLVFVYLLALSLLPSVFLSVHRLGHRCNATLADCAYSVRRFDRCIGGGEKAEHSSVSRSSLLSLPLSILCRASVRCDFLTE